MKSKNQQELERIKRDGILTIKLFIVIFAIFGLTILITTLWK